MCSQWYETFGMVIAEAYSNGTPVIVGNVGNIKDLVIDGNTGFLFDYDSVEGLVSAVRKMNKADGRKLGENGYNLFKERLSAEANYAQLKDIYEKVE